MEITDRLYSIKPFESYPSEQVRCEFCSYHYNGTMAMRLYGTDSRIPESTDISKQYCVPYANVTVNLDVSHLLGYDQQFIDESNLPGIGRWLEENGIARPTGIIAPSGYNMYEAYQFLLPEKTLKEVKERRSTLGTEPPRITIRENNSNHSTPKPRK